MKKTVNIWEYKVGINAIIANFVFVKMLITLECFLCLCEAVIESYSCMGDSVQFV